MTTFMSDEVRAGLDAARKRSLGKSSRLRVMVGDELFRVTRMWEGGFAVKAATTPRLRGLVELYDGSRHLSQCLIIAAALDGDEMVYDFKRNTQATDRAPLDFVRPDDAPVALLGRATR